MALKLKLRPGEHIYISGALLRNGPNIAEFEVLNRVPILREKDILLEADADTPCKRLYLIIQALYIDPSAQLECYRLFSSVSLEIFRAAPSTAPYFEKIHPLVSEGRYYSALKEVKRLIDYEATLLQHAKRSE